MLFIGNFPGKIMPYLRLHRSKVGKSNQTMSYTPFKFASLVRDFLDTRCVDFFTYSLYARGKFSKMVDDLKYLQTVWIQIRPNNMSGLI